LLIEPSLSIPVLNSRNLYYGELTSFVIRLDLNTPTILGITAVFGANRRYSSNNSPNFRESTGDFPSRWSNSLYLYSAGSDQMVCGSDEIRTEMFVLIFTIYSMNFSWWRDDRTKQMLDLRSGENFPRSIYQLGS